MDKKTNMNYDYNRAASDDRGPQSNNPLSEQRPSTNINMKKKEEEAENNYILIIIFSGTPFEFESRK